MKEIKEALKNSMSYTEYRSMVDSLREAGRTTGSDHSDDMLLYTDLNIARMNKWDKRFELTPIVSDSTAYENEIWLVITEAWCGDAAHALPVITKLADARPHVSLHIVLRDENLELMHHFSTNGSLSIPKLIRLNAQTLEVIGDWGARPKELQEIFLKRKSEGLSKEEINKEVQIWYARNRGKAIEAELLELLNAEVLSS